MITTHILVNLLTALSSPRSSPPTCHAAYYFLPPPRKKIPPPRSLPAFKIYLSPLWKYLPGEVKIAKKRGGEVKKKTMAGARSPREAYRAPEDTDNN